MFSRNVLEDDYNMMVYQTVLPFCNYIYEITMGNCDFDKIQEYRDKGEMLYKKNFPERTQEDLEHFIDNAYAFYYQLTGNHYFCGKTAFWKEVFKGCSDKNSTI